MQAEIARVRRGPALTILSWIIPILCLTSVSLAAETVDREALLAAYVEVWNTGELDRLDEIIAADFQRHAGPDESVRSRNDLRELISQSQAIWRDLRITVDDQMTTADSGAFRGEFHGVHAEVGGVVQFPVMSMVRFADGLIAEEWIIGNNFMPLMMLGYELVPPGFEAIPPPASSDSPTDHSSDHGNR